MADLFSSLETRRRLSRAEADLKALHLSQVRGCSPWQAPRTASHGMLATAAPLVGGAKILLRAPVPNEEVLLGVYDGAAGLVRADRMGITLATFALEVVCVGEEQLSLYRPFTDSFLCMDTRNVFGSSAQIMAYKMWPKASFSAVGLADGSVLLWCADACCYLGVLRHRNKWLLAPFDPTAKSELAHSSFAVRFLPVAAAP